MYSEVISVSWTPALGAMRFGNGLWCGYVAYKTRARLNVFYSGLCLTDPECGAFLGRQRRVRVDNIIERHPSSCGFSQFRCGNPNYI